MASDPLVSLASSIHAGPGVFALLLGSGVSASSGVPTGWDVSLDLIQRLAVLREEQAGDDPISWYRSYSDGEPDYSALLSDLARSPVDRRNLLKPYFEPTEDEKARGLKLPTKAHEAIAKLVADGFIKVIVTTNFDQLLETALREIGIRPNVISSPAHVAGALPLVHSPCSIIKVNGDYLSPDLRNTVEELETYDLPLDRLLDEIFDQYGLVVCGWSGTWDTALRRAILRSPNRRFATFWLHREELSPEAEEIVNHRSGISLSISDADSVFESLEGKVKALSDAIDQRPQDTSLAIAELKKHLPEPRSHIRLHELVIGEIRNSIELFRDLQMPDNTDLQNYTERLKVYEAGMFRTLKLLAIGAFFSDQEEHDFLWTKCIEELATRRMKQSGNRRLIKLEQYPTLLALYAVALGSVAAGRIEPIARSLGTVKVREHQQDLPVGIIANSWEVFNGNSVKQIRNSLTPASDYLLDALRPIMSEIIREEKLEDIFDEAEYLLGLSYISLDGGDYGPVGRATWRTRYGHRFPGDIVDRHQTLLVDMGALDPNNFAAARERYDDLIRSSS